MVDEAKSVTRVIARLDEGDERFRASMQGIERRALLDLVRAADHTGFSRSMSGPAPTVAQRDYLKASWLGVAPALALCGQAGFSGEGVEWAPSNEQNERWANAFLNRMGLAANTRRLCGLARSNLTEVHWHGDARVRIKVTAQDSEAVDREAIRWYSSTVNEENRPLLSTLHTLLGGWVGKQLQSRVEFDPVFGIRYSSSEELEEYFEAQAELRAGTLPGHDSLPDDVRLGSVTFGDFRRAVIMAMGRALKHVAFVETLLDRKPDTSFRTVLTTFATEVNLADQWRSRLGLSQSQMRDIMQVLAVTADDLPHLSKAYDAPQAMLIFAADGYWHQPVYGALNNPFGWLTRKLRRTYASDWDRAVDLREAAFRQDIRTRFPEPRFYFCPKPTLLKGPSGVKTDVDAIVIDRKTGMMGVFQLKWQEPYEFSLAERDSRRKNLAKEGNRWISVVNQHCAGLSPVGCAAALGVEPEQAELVQTMRLIILTRNGAQFSGPVEQSDRAAWLSWFELLRRVAEDKDDDPLEHICRPTPVPSPHDEGGFEYTVDGLRIEVGA